MQMDRSVSDVAIYWANVLYTTISYPFYM